MKTKHILGYCIGCQTEMVFCATCGNNCCNATHGIVNGVECPDCPDAYDMQAQHWEHPGSVEFAEDRR